MSDKLDYKQAGVDIDIGNQIVDDIKTQVRSTFSPSVLTGIGSFGSLFDLKKIINDYNHPVLVQSIDGLGTKPIIARMARQYDTLGIDILSATVNDIIVLGAKPINFLDYIASDKLSPAVVKQLIAGMVSACRAEDIALVGGETAEMPDVYAGHEYDVVGVITGVVERDNIIDGKTIQAGDKVYALPSSGLHTNGYSLARKALFDRGNFQIDSHVNELGMTIGDALLKPHINYNQPVRHLLDQGINIKGMAHITGGGVIDNIPRILPADCAVKLNKRDCPIPPIFSLIQQVADLEEDECYRAFNMGMGLILIGDDSIAENINSEIHLVGEVIQGKHEIYLQ
ncbi:MAG: phosphoribosylformylglycinamidine cyclo-ligase [Pseudomonadota bacterium]